MRFIHEHKHAVLMRLMTKADHFACIAHPAVIIGANDQDRFGCGAIVHCLLIACKRGMHKPFRHGRLGKMHFDAKIGTGMHGTDVHISGQDEGVIPMECIADHGVHPCRASAREQQRMRRSCAFGKVFLRFFDG